MWSGHEVDEEKSSIFFTKNTIGSMRVCIRNVIGIKEMGSQGYTSATLLFLEETRGRNSEELKKK